MAVDRLTPTRCGWCGTEEIYVNYHDQVWGRPVADSRELFEKLCLDGQQAGLSWITILKKQANYEKAFDQFNPEKIARYTDKRVEKLLQNPGIVRNRLKVNSIIKNARAYLAMEEAGTPFNEFIWQFVDGKPIINEFTDMSQVPANTEVSDQMSKALKKAGFSFVGSTIVYAFMQAVGIVNDHLVSCHCYQPCAKAQKAFRLN